MRDPIDPFPGGFDSCSPSPSQALCLAMADAMRILRKFAKDALALDLAAIHFGLIRARVVVDRFDTAITLRQCFV